MPIVGAGARRYSGTETDTSVDQSKDYMVLQVRAVRLSCLVLQVFSLVSKHVKWTDMTFSSKLVSSVC